MYHSVATLVFKSLKIFPLIMIYSLKDTNWAIYYKLNTVLDTGNTRVNKITMYSSGTWFDKITLFLSKSL